MQAGKRTPWRDWSEWQSVYELLNSRREQALARLEQWKGRGTLPVVVECTRLMLAVSKSVTGNCNFAGLEDVESTRLMLGMCVIRVVNQVTDLHQKSKNAIPISAVATLISMPEYIVDIRHTATHGDLPSLFLLEKAVRDLYSYLINTYWVVQWSQIQQREAEIDAKFQKYMKKAKHTTEGEVLIRTAVEAFKQLDTLQVHKAYLPSKLLSLYPLLPEESWAPLVAHLHTHIKGLAEMCIETALQRVGSKAEGLAEVKGIVEAIAAVAGGIQIPLTHAVKRLFTLQNTNEEAYELTSFLLEAGAFPQSAIDGIREIHNTALISDAEVCGKDGQEINPEKMKIWTRVKYWSAKEIGSCTPLLTS